MGTDVGMYPDDAIQFFQGRPYPVGRSASGNAWDKQSNRPGGGKSRSEGDKRKYQGEEEYGKMFFAHAGYLLFNARSYLFREWYPGYLILDEVHLGFRTV